MLTKVILDGPMGKRFGREWNLAARSPQEALQLIDANEPGLLRWIRANVQKYAKYRVTITTAEGKKVKLSDQDYGLERKAPAVIRFTPITAGASGGMKVAVAAVLLVISYVFPPTAPYLVPMAISLMIGGLVEMLSPRPKKPNSSPEDNAASYYFNGAVNTTQQGVPVPLVYGRCMVGSQAVSASITVDQLMD